MSEEQKRPRVLLLPDDPSEVDEFEAKAHDRVAGAIAEVINEEAGGKIIGLEGSWGSGKSTVVRLISKHFAGTRKSATSRDTRLVVFDAWAHQGDPLRRTFLESLISELHDAGWISEKATAELTGKLSGRRSSARTKSTSRLSLEGQLAAATAVLLPLGGALFANRFHSHHRLAMWIGALLLLAPFLVIVGFVLAWILGVLTGGKKQRSGWRWRFAYLHPFNFFAKDQQTKTTTDEIVQGEPTSVEFEGLFGDILDEALNDHRRLLVVLDNVDRVAETDARTVIATMQTFTSPSAYAKRSWRNDVWMLIPFDPAGLDRLWDSSEPENDRGAHVEDGGPLTSSTAVAFLEKLFHMRFEAPPLILSDWRSYLTRLLQKAMPDAQDSDIQAVLRLRAFYPGVEKEGLTAKDAPTPRQLKQFVNQTGGIQRQRDDDVPLVHIAYYALLRRDRINVPDRLIDGSIPHPELLPLFSEGIQADLAALHFGTTRSLAQQLLLGGALEEAFAASNSTAIEQLKDRPGFIDAVESLDLTSRGADGAIELTRIVAVLDTAGAFAVASVAAWFKDAVLPVARKIQSWALSGSEAGAGLAVLLDSLSSNDDKVLARLLGRVEAKPREVDTDGRLHLEGLAGLLDALGKRGRADESVRVQIEIPPERIATSVAFFGSKTEDARSRAGLELSIGPTDVAHALVEAATSESFADVPAALEVLLIRPERVDLGTLASGCIEWLKEQDPGSEGQLSVLLGVVDRARQAGHEILAPAAQDGTLMHVVGVASANEWSREAADASMLHLLAEPGLGTPAEVRQASAGTDLIRGTLTDPSGAPEIVSAQLGWLQAHADEAVDLLLRVSEADSSFQPWVDSQLDGLDGASALVVLPSQFLQAWPDLQRVLGEDRFGQLLKKLLSTRANRKAITAGSADPDLAIVTLAASAGEKYVKEIQGWAEGILKDTSSADWQAVLLSPDGGPILKLALEVADGADAPVDPPGLSDALHAHSQALAAGETAWQPDAETFGKLTSTLGAGARKVVASQLSASLEGRDGKVGSGLFATYGTFLASEQEFRTHAKLPNFIERAVAHDEWDSVEWIVGLSRDHADTLQTKGRKEEIKHLRTRVVEKLGELSEAESEPPEALTALSELLGS